MVLNIKKLSQIILSFLRLHSSTAFQTFCWLWGIFHFFLEISAHSISIKFPIPIFFCSLIPKVSMFTLAISCLTTSNLPWFMVNHIPGSCAIFFFATLDFTFTTRRFHNWAFFLLWLSLFVPSGAFSWLFSSSVLGTYWLGSSSFSFISFCLFILFMGFSRQECWCGLHSLL